jgi:7-cyano-7-deazaguanine synthase in queuosine biosynthesis
MNNNVLINFSGGIDSTYAAWESLRSGDTPILHHCVLRGRDDRWRFEREAVSNILKYFNKVGLNKYRYIESGFDYGSIGHLIYDVEVIGFLSGVVLRNPKYAHINRIIVSVNANDPTGQDINNFRRTQANAYTELVVGKTISWEYPMIHMDKSEIIRKMPRDLVDASWWCRRPQSSGKPCGYCRSCKETMPTIKSLTK